MHTVRFELEIPQAQGVFVAGTFNSWNPIANPLTPAADGRIWACELRLPSGRYEYRFVADGEWMDDPNATERVGNQLGGANAVIDVCPNERKTCRQ